MLHERGVRDELRAGPIAAPSTALWSLRYARALRRDGPGGRGVVGRPGAPAKGDAMNQLQQLTELQHEHGWLPDDVAKHLKPGG